MRSGDGARKRIGRAYGLRKRRATETFQPAYGGVPYLANVIVPLISWPAASAMPRLVRHRCQTSHMRLRRPDGETFCCAVRPKGPYETSLDYCDEEACEVDLFCGSYLPRRGQDLARSCAISA